MKLEGLSIRLLGVNIQGHHGLAILSDLMALDRLQRSTSVFRWTAYNSNAYGKIKNSVLSLGLDTFTCQTMITLCSQHHAIHMAPVLPSLPIRLSMTCLSILLTALHIVTKPPVDQTSISGKYHFTITNASIIKGLLCLNVCGLYYSVQVTEQAWTLSS